MISVVSSLLSENLGGLAFFIALALLTTWIGISRGYYSNPYKSFRGPLVTIKDVISYFFIFIGCYFLVLPTILSALLIKFNVSSHSLYNFLAHIITFLTTATLFYLYSRFDFKKQIGKVIKDFDFPGAKPIFSDMKLGIKFWFIAMPVVASITYLSEIITNLIVKPTNKEQIAVKYLKSALDEPLTLFIALFSILIVAPIFEEFLFRGILLSYFKTKTSLFKSIILSSLIFSLFHFSPAQGSENVSLIFTLFVFASYLGFVYEKTRSLYTSILLHVTFNSISVIRIIFINV
jgi:membrane protease YdiL (CAAX protease family)